MKDRDLDETLLPGVPERASGEDRDRLLRAQGEARRAIREAEDLHRQARNARRRARSRTQRYEELIAEFHGQLSLRVEE